MKDLVIFVGCYKGDYHLAKILCQSIRYFCGDILIVLIKDGNFNTSQIKKLGNIREFDRKTVPDPLRNLAGWGLPKLLAFFQDRFQRFLYLDSDTVLLNNILEIPFLEADFYVDSYLPGEDFASDRFGQWLRTYIFNIEKLSSLDPEFVLNDRMIYFNTGQMFGRSGLLCLDVVLECIKHWVGGNDIFACADQGILNYILNKGAQSGSFTLEGAKFKIGAGYETIERFPGLTSDNLVGCRFRDRYVIHFAGMGHSSIDKSSYSFVMEKFYARYYKHFLFYVEYLDRLGRIQSDLLRKARNIGRSVLSRSTLSGV